MSLLRPDDPRHGTHNGYNNYRCRCEACVEAAKAYRRDKDHNGYHRSWAHRTGRSRSRADYLAEIAAQHGSESKYRTGCRCDECTAVSREMRKRRRHANIEATRAYDREYKRRRRAAA